MIVPGSALSALAYLDFEPFVGEERFLRLLEFARELPIAVNALGLELRLGDRADEVDYLISLKDQVEVVSALAHSLRDEIAFLPAGSRVGDFLKEWVAPDGRVRSRAPLLWLEYDQGDVSFAREPGLFVAPAGCFDETVVDEMTPFFDHLYGVTDALALKEAFAGTVHALPGNSRVKHLGAMPSRNPSFLRCVLEDIDAKMLLKVLANLGWPGHLGSLNHILSDIADHTFLTPARVDLDFCDGIQPKLGLEFLLVGDQAPTDGGVSLLELLRDRGLCSQAKFRSMSQWLSWKVTQLQDSAPALWSKLYHVKVTVANEPGAAAPTLEAKAYWGGWSGPGKAMIDALHLATTGHNA